MENLQTLGDYLGIDKASLIRRFLALCFSTDNALVLSKVLIHAALQDKDKRVLHVSPQLKNRKKHSVSLECSISLSGALGSAYPKCLTRDCSIGIDAPNEPRRATELAVNAKCPELILC
jgi:hypothetical protein